MKGKNHSHDEDNAGKDCGRVQLHQDGQEDVRKAPFHGQFASIWPVPTMFTAKEANQTTEMGVVSVGKGFSHYVDSRRRETFSVDFTVCKLQMGKCTQ